MYWRGLVVRRRSGCTDGPQDGPVASLGDKGRTLVHQVVHGHADLLHFHVGSETRVRRLDDRNVLLGGADRPGHDLTIHVVDLNRDRPQKRDVMRIDHPRRDGMRDAVDHSLEPLRDRH